MLVTTQASDPQKIKKPLLLGMGLKNPFFDTENQFGIQNIVSELEKLAKDNKFYEPDQYLISLK